MTMGTRNPHSLKYLLQVTQPAIDCCPLDPKIAALLPTPCQRLLDAPGEGCKDPEKLIPRDPRYPPTRLNARDKNCKYGLRINTNLRIRQKNPVAQPPLRMVSATTLCRPTSRPKMSYIISRSKLPSAMWMGCQPKWRRLVAPLGFPPSATKSSLCHLPHRRFLWATYLENGADECVLRLSRHTQCMSVSVPGTC